MLGVIGSTARRKGIVLKLPLMDDLKALYEKDARYTESIGALGPKLQHVCVFLHGKLPELKLTDFTKSLTLFQFSQEVLANNKSLKDQVLKLKEMGPGE